MSEREQSWRAAAPPDLATRIAEGVRQRRRGKHAPDRRPRHRVATRPGRARARAGLRTAALLLVTVLAVTLLRAFVIASFYIPSESMEPTLHGCAGCQPDRVLVDKLTYHFTTVSRQDVIVFGRPPDLPIEDKDLIKRVIGLPGDTLAAHGGSVYVNGERLNEPYVNPACHGTTDFGPVTVPSGRYFVMGDNRCNSSDSRVFGTIARGSIIGRAFVIVWPFKRWRIL